MLADKLTPRQFSELAGLDYEMAQVVYAAEQGDYGKLMGNIASYKVPLIDMVLFVCEQADAGIIQLDAEQMSMLSDAGTIISMLFVLFVLPQILLLGGGLADKTSISMPTAARTHQSRERVFVVGLVTGEISGTVSGLVRASVDGNVNLRVISGRIADGAQPENPRLEEGSHEEE